jgi:CTP-dependent riboflavin kinase
LKKLKTTKDKKILVVTHGGIIDIIQRILCNIESKIIKNYYISTKPFTDRNEIMGNCTCFYVGLENNKFHLVMPPNTYHLQ